MVKDAVFAALALFLARLLPIGIGERRLASVHKAAHIGKQDLVRIELDESAARLSLRVGGIERWDGVGILQIFEDDCRIKERQIVVDQHWHLALRIGGDDVRVLRSVAFSLRERHLDAFEIDALFMKGDFDLPGEQAEGSGIEPHTSFPTRVAARAVAARERAVQGKSDAPDPARRLQRQFPSRSACDPDQYTPV
jgi:hypothetical protein